MNELAKEILDTVEVGALATVNVDRTPLITPLHFARFGNSIIWIFIHWKARRTLLGLWWRITSCWREFGSIQALWSA